MQRLALRCALALSLGLTAVGTLAAPSASAATGTITGLGGKCLDVAGASSADGTAVQIYDCNGTAAQQWTVGSDGTIRALGKCLDITGNSTANGAQLQLWTCGGSANQQWTVSAARDIVNPAANKCLDVTGSSTRPTAPAPRSGPAPAPANQQWTAPGRTAAPPPPTTAAMAVAPVHLQRLG
jgi:hypothetical protein